MNSGFYKKEENNDKLLYAQTFVSAPLYMLISETKDDYEYPIDGWYWFDDETDAYNFWNLELPKSIENKLEPPSNSYTIPPIPPIPKFDVVG